MLEPFAFRQFRIPSRPVRLRASYRAGAGYLLNRCVTFHLTLASAELLPAWTRKR
jgi:hypothetical protein